MEWDVVMEWNLYRTIQKLTLFLLVLPCNTYGHSVYEKIIFTERDKGKYKTVPSNVNNDNIACVICFLGEYALQLFQLNWHDILFINC